MSGLLSVTETDYEAIACACLSAWERGETELAERLNDFCRKANASLSAASIRGLHIAGPRPKVVVDGPLDIVRPRK